MTMTTTPACSPQRHSNNNNGCLQPPHDDAHLQSSRTTVMSTMSTYGLCLWNIEDDIYLLCVEAHRQQWRPSAAGLQYAEARLTTTTPTDGHCHRRGTSTTSTCSKTCRRRPLAAPPYGHCRRGTSRELAMSPPQPPV